MRSKTSNFQKGGKPVPPLHSAAQFAPGGSFGCASPSTRYSFLTSNQKAMTTKGRPVQQTVNNLTSSASPVVAGGSSSGASSRTGSSSTWSVQASGKAPDFWHSKACECKHLLPLGQLKTSCFALPFFYYLPKTRLRSSSLLAKLLALGILNPVANQPVEIRTIIRM